MRIGIAQINTVPGAFDQTVERMLAQARRAAEQGAELVVFPLAALAGLELPSYADRPSFLADAAEAVATLAQELPCPAIVPIPIDLGAPEVDFDVLLVKQGEITPLCMAARMREAQSTDDDPVELPEFDLGGLHFIVALTYEDLDLLSDYDIACDVCLYLSGYPFAMDDSSSAMAADFEASRFWEDACRSESWIVGVAPVGGYGDQVFCGSSFVASPGGALAATLPAFEEALQVVEVGGGPETVEDIGMLSREVFDAPFHLWQAVSLGIHDFVTKQGLADVVVALDASLSSQVLLALASDALGPLHVHALVGAAAGSNAPACRDLARRLHVHQVDGPGALAGFDAHDLDELSLAALAREHRALVLSSIDKTALALGAAAGRVSAASLLPLGDVYRTDVLDMAHVRNTISPIFRRVVLGEADALALGAEDGSVMMVSGEQELMLVDETLLGFVEYDRPLSELIGEDRHNEALVDGVLRTLRSAESVRRSLAPVLAMSTHTLDEARFPLGVSWQDVRREGVPEADLEHLGSVVRIHDEGDHPDNVSSVPTPAPPQNQRASHDLGGTLRMLRDLAEQGGFLPDGAQGLFDSQSWQRGISSADGEGGPGTVAWGGSIFSEN